MSTPRFAWSRVRNSRIGAADSYVLRRAGVTYAMVQKHSRGWFSYGLGASCKWNTSDAPTDLETAKADALRRVKEALGEVSA